MLLAQAQRTQFLSGQWAGCPHPEFGHADFGAQQVHAFGRWTDTRAGLGCQGRTQDVGRREYRSGANLNQRLAVLRGIGQRIQRAGKAMLAHHQGQGGIGVVPRIGDDGPGLAHVEQGRRIFGQLSKNHLVAAVA